MKVCVLEKLDCCFGVIREVSCWQFYGTLFCYEVISEMLLLDCGCLRSCECKIAWNALFEKNIRDRLKILWIRKNQIQNFLQFQN